MWLSNRAKMDQDKLQEIEHDGETLLDFSTAVGEHQVRCGNAYIQEHPLRARTWNKENIMALEAEAEATGTVSKVMFDQCAVGLKSPRGYPIKKPTCLLCCNIEAVPARLKNKKCKCSKYYELGGVVCSHRVCWGGV